MKTSNTMKLSLSVYLVFICFVLHAQPKSTTETEPTKQQALDYLKNIISDQVQHYDFGGPLQYPSNSSYYFAKNIKVISVNMTYDILEVKYKTTGLANEVEISRKTSLKSEFEVYENCICTIKNKSITLTDKYEANKRYGEAFLCFDENSSMMNKAMNAIVYLQKFITKDPFDN